MNRKQILGLIVAGIFPVISFASGGSDMHGHDAKGHGMTMEHGMKGHDMGGHGMEGHNMSDMHKEGQSAAIGKPGDSSQVSRTVEVLMGDDMRFTPASVDVKAGETIRFFIKNTGSVPHEMVLGNPKELKEHAEMMRSMPDMQHHDSPNMVSLKPGQRGGMVWQFTQAGTVDFACTIPGHMESGMVGKVTVTQ